MKFNYCPKCGTRLVKRMMDDEGVAPYCETCHRPRFDLFKVAVIGLVENERGEVALIRQRTFSRTYESLVSGFVNEGERAESAMEREIGEELGIAVDSLRVEGTHWFDAKGILMMGFFARARKQRFRLTAEVDAAHWVSLPQAARLVHPKPAISRELVEARMTERGLALPEAAPLCTSPLHGGRTRLHPALQPVA